MSYSTEQAWKSVDKAVYSGAAGKSNEHYTQWAENYDEDLNTLRFATDSNVSKEAMKHIENKSDTTILDIAAGTGRCAEVFKTMGFVGIMDALEINASMLEKAKSKKMYRNHIEAGVYPDKPLPVKSASYDAAIIAGAMLPHHLEPGCLEVIMDCLRPGGVVAFNVRATEQCTDYRRELNNIVDKLTASGKLEEIDHKKMAHFEVNYHSSGERIMTIVYVYRKL